MFENEKVFSCYGHSYVKLTELVKAAVGKEIEEALLNGFTVFLFGGLSNFDDFVYDVVSEKKLRHQEFNIKRVFCFSLENQLRKPPVWFKKKEYEEFICPIKSFDYWYQSIYFRNLAMIDMSDKVLFFAMEMEESGAYKAYKYAKKAHKEIVNLANLKV